MKLTKRQLEILQHALGVDEYGRLPEGFTDYSRNYFCAGPDDEQMCRQLVEMGYMKTFQNCIVTLEGMKAVREDSPKPPKSTRSQQRYQQFLDCGGARA